MHRSWRDAEMYFFFNESNQAESRTATIAGRGQAQVWDLATGEIHAMAAAVAENDSVRFSAGAGTLRSETLRGGAASQPEWRLRSRLWHPAILWRNWAETGRWT